MFVSQKHENCPTDLDENFRDYSQKYQENLDNSLAKFGNIPRAIIFELRYTKTETNRYNYFLLCEVGLYSWTYIIKKYNQELSLLYLLH